MKWYRFWTSLHLLTLLALYKLYNYYYFTLTVSDFWPPVVAGSLCNVHSTNGSLNIPTAYTQQNKNPADITRAASISEPLWSWRNDNWLPLHGAAERSVVNSITQPLLLATTAAFWSISLSTVTPYQTRPLEIIGIFKAGCPMCHVNNTVTSTETQSKHQVCSTPMNSQ